VDGVIAKAAVGDFALGPVSLTDAAIDLTLTRDEQYFRMSGAADLLIMQAAIDVDFALTEMSFDAEGKAFDLFMADVHAVGKANLQDPQFTVAGQLRNDFDDAIIEELIAGALTVADTRVEAAIRERDRAVARYRSTVDARTRARNAWLQAPAFPRSTKAAARSRYFNSIYAARMAGYDAARRTLAVGVWVSVREVLQVAKNRTAGDPLISIRSAAFDGDLSRMKDGQVAKLALDLEVQGQQMKLSNAGFNFRDMGAGVRDMAEQIVENLFRSRS